VPATPLPRLSAVPLPVLTPMQKRVRAAKRTLAARGLMEAMTWSFVSKEQAALFGGVPDSLLLANPISADLDAMRPSVLPGLLAAAQRNAARGLKDGGLFEVGPQFTGPEPGEQLTAATGIRMGAPPRHWSHDERPVDLYQAKADVLAILEASGFAADTRCGITRAVRVPCASARRTCSPISASCIRACFKPMTCRVRSQRSK
jgi:phenylalanyl-tRNA synthetase beta chain